MNKQRGFTLIELLILGAFVAILFTVIFSAASGLSNSTVSFGINGTTEMRCIDGYRFIIGSDGSTRQVMDQLGHGVKCTSM